MFKCKVLLDSISKVKSFVNTVSGLEYEFELISGSYSINAKSIMGIFSLDLSQPLELNVNCEADNSDVKSYLDPYIVEII